MKNASPLRQYVPILALIFVSVLSTFQAAVTDDVLSNSELVNLVIAVLMSIALYVVPRLPGVTWLKPALAFLTAAFQAILSFMSDGISMSEWTQIILTAFAAIGVAASNKFVPVMEPVKTAAIGGAVVPDAKL